MAMTYDSHDASSRTCPSSQLTIPSSSNVAICHVFYSLRFPCRDNNCRDYSLSRIISKSEVADMSTSISFHPSYRCETVRMSRIRRVITLCVHKRLCLWILLILHEETRSRNLMSRASFIEISVIQKCIWSLQLGDHTSRVCASRSSLFLSFIF